MIDENKRESFGSRVGFVLAAAGSAVGLGNLWKFPYIAGKNGGAAFLFIYIVIIVCIGVTAMTAEVLIGRMGRLIEISHKDAGKHSGLRFIREYLNLKPEETAAFGDGDNDIDLLKEAGIGIAMENASSKCKDAATFITKHHDKDGVAYGITEFLKI